MILSLSEYVALRVGIAVRPEPGQLWWSAVLNDWQAEESNYTQTIGESVFTLRISCTGPLAAACHEPHSSRLSDGGARTHVTAAQRAVAEVGAEPIFWFNGSSRLVTNLRGELVSVIGVDAQPADVCVGLLSPATNGDELCLKVEPNEEWSLRIVGGKLVGKRTRSVAFTAQF